MTRWLGIGVLLLISGCGVDQSRVTTAERCEPGLPGPAGVPGRACEYESSARTDGATEALLLTIDLPAEDGSYHLSARVFQDQLTGDRLTGAGEWVGSYARRSGTVSIDTSKFHVYFDQLLQDTSVTFRADDGEAQVVVKGSDGESVKWGACANLYQVKD